MMEEKVKFKSKSGTKLFGAISYPKTPSGKIVIICHGFTGNINEPQIKRFANFLAKNGYAAFRFDFFAHGKSKGRFIDLDLSEEIDNLNAALKLVSKKFYSIGIVGHSLGGLIASKLSNRTKAVVLWSPTLFVKESFLEIFNSKYCTSIGQNIPRLIEKNGFVELPTKYWGFDYQFNYSPFKIGIRFWTEIKGFDSKKNIRKIKTPTKIIQAGKDDIVPPILNRRAFTYLNTEKNFKIIENADHDFKGSYKKLFSLTLDWFKKFL